MRSISLIVVHCSDSDIPSHDNVETIRKWHTLPKIPEEIKQRIKNGSLPKSEAFKYGNGWRDIGYHFFIDKRGDIYTGRPENIAGAHTRGFNDRSLGICLSGRREFTPRQFESLERLCLELTQKYDLEKQDIVAHNSLDSKKSCPNFDLHAVLATWSWH